MCPSEQCHLVGACRTCLCSCCTMSSVSTHHDMCMWPIRDQIKHDIAIYIPTIPQHCYIHTNNTTTLLYTYQLCVQDTPFFPSYKRICGRKIMLFHSKNCAARIKELVNSTVLQVG